MSQAVESLFHHQMSRLAARGASAGEMSEAARRILAMQREVALETKRDAKTANGPTAAAAQKWTGRQA